MRRKRVLFVKFYIKMKNFLKNSCKTVYKSFNYEYNVMRSAKIIRRGQMKPADYDGGVMGVKYVKCPRCDLNYIPDTEELCEVCKAELKLVHSSIYSDDAYDDDSVLCPYCKQNFIGVDEEMCFACAERLKYEHSSSMREEEEDDSWREYLDDEKETSVSDDGMDIVSFSELEEEEKDSFDEEEEEIFDYDDHVVDDFEEYDDDEDFDDEDDEEDDEDEDDED